MKELIKISSILGLGRIANILLGIIRIKVAAVFLAPFGMGIVSQINAFQSLLGRVVDLGIGAGVTKYVAEYSSQKDDKKLSQLISTAVIGFAITGLVMIVVVMLGSSYFAKLMLDDSTFYGLIILAGIAVAVKTQFQIIERTLQGLLKMKAMVKLSLLSAGIGIVISTPMIIFFNIYGAVISLVLINVITLVVAQIYLQRLLQGEFQLKISRKLVDKEIIINLLKFGGANSTVFLATTVTLLIIRSIIIKDLGAESNGLYQVAVGVATQYIGLIATATWQYGMPKVATMLGQKEAIQTLQNDVTRLNLLVLTPTIILLLLSRDIWIPILYSSSFIGAYSLIAWQLLGELIRSIKWGPNMVNQPYERFQFIILQSILTAVSFLGAFLLLLPHYGLIAAPLSYVISQVIMAVFALCGHYYYDRFLFNKENWLLTILSITIVAVIIYYSREVGSVGINIYLIGGLLLTGWFFINIKQQERQQLLSFIKKYVKRN